MAQCQSNLKPRAQGSAKLGFRVSNPGEAGVSWLQVGQSGDSADSDSEGEAWRLQGPWETCVAKLTDRGRLHRRGGDRALKQRTAAVTGAGAGAGAGQLELTPVEQRRMGKTDVSPRPFSASTVPQSGVPSERNQSVLSKALAGVANLIADAQTAKWQARYGRDPTDQQRAWLVNKVRTDIAMRATKLNAQVQLMNLQAMYEKGKYILFCKITRRGRQPQTSGGSWN